MPNYLIDHSPRMYPLSKDFYMYEGCHDSPFKLTGDCYPRQRAWERSHNSQQTAYIKAENRKKRAEKAR